MKKVICLCLTALLLCPAACGLAGGIGGLWDSPTATPAPYTFSFRSGIQWNMTRELVRALETQELTERVNGNWSILIPLAPVEVSRYKADLVYMFLNDQLKMISYDFGSGGTESDYQYLTGALDSVYGEHAEPNAAEILIYLDLIYPGHYSADNLLNRRGWTASDGTLVYLYYYSPTAYTILYVCPGAGQAGYNTAGL